jgi:hypothetical protein
MDLCLAVFRAIQQLSQCTAFYVEALNPLQLPVKFHVERVQMLHQTKTVSELNGRLPCCLQGRPAAVNTAYPLL